MAGKKRDISKPLHTGVKKSANEYTIYEVLSLLGYDVNDVDKGQKRIHDLLTRHDALFVGRCINTLHGPAFYYDKKAIEELKRIEEVNRERRELEEQREVLRKHLFNASVGEVLPFGNGRKEK